ncbi:hypothetical protein H8356DRAFT_1340836 [Neocallimastix lanati (nom. inval.)]|nr:hypothetical protein H8356DRAFT_1340836 [Neocallimastix sp. JGI-2020a]
MYRTPDTHPLEGKTEKKVLEVASGTSGTGPESINSAIQLSQTSGENTIKQDADKPENNTLLLSHEEDIEMKEYKEMEEVEKYFDILPTENPSLESSFKNAYGGATFLLAQDAVYKQMQAQLLAQENANKLLQRQIQLLTQQIQTFMNNQNQTAKLNLIYNKLDSDLYLTQDKVDSLNNQLKQIKHNTNISKLNNNFEYNQRVIEETKKTQKKNIDELNDKIIQISNENALIIKGKMNEDEISKTKINQFNQYNNVEDSLKTIINQLNHFQDKIDGIQDQIELTDNKLT